MLNFVYFIVGWFLVQALVDWYNRRRIRRMLASHNEQIQGLLDTNNEIVQGKLNEHCDLMESYSTRVAKIVSSVANIRPRSFDA